MGEFNVYTEQTMPHVHGPGILPERHRARPFILLEISCLR